MALPIVVLWDSFNLVEVGLNVIVGPKIFAIGVGFVLLFLVLLQIVAVLRGDRGVPESIEAGEVSSKSNFRGLAIVIAAIVFHILALELIGFILATIPLFVAVAFALGERKWIRSLIVGTIISVVTFFGFTEGLELQLPVGFEFITEQPTVVNEDVDVVDDGEESW